MLCEIDRASLNLSLSSLTNISLKEFNRLENSFFVAFDFNVSVTEERFKTQLEALEKAALKEYSTQVFDLESIGSITSEDALSAQSQSLNECESCG